MAFTFQLLTDIAPEFANADQARVMRLAAIVGTQFNVPQMGNQLDLATAYLVAHVLKIGQNKGNGGITKRRIGDLETGYSSRGQNAREDGLDATSYGMEYLRLLKLRAPRGPLITGYCY